MSAYLPLTLAQSNPAPAAPGNGAATPVPTTPGTPGIPVANSASGDTGTTTAPSPGLDPMFMVILLGAMVLMIFLTSRRDRKEKKRMSTMLAAMKKGDRVQTIGGILGTVMEVKETEVLVKVDESSNARMHFTRQAIQAILTDGKPQDIPAK